MGTLLIIDGDTESVQNIRPALIEHGIDVKVIAEGNESVEWASKHQPACILLSVEMVRGSGYAVCNRLRKDPSTLGIALILASEQAGENTITQHQQLKTHADHYIKKPYEIKKILAILAAYFPDMKNRNIVASLDPEATIGMSETAYARPKPISEERTAMLSDAIDLQTQYQQGFSTRSKKPVAQEFFAQQVSESKAQDLRQNINKTVVAQRAQPQLDADVDAGQVSTLLPDESTSVESPENAPVLSRMASQDIAHQNQMLSHEVAYLRDKIQKAEKELGNYEQQAAQHKKIAKESQSNVEHLNQQLQALQSQYLNEQKQLQALRTAGEELGEQTRQLSLALDKSQQQRQQLEQAHAASQRQYQAEHQKLIELEQMHAQKLGDLQALRDEKQSLANTHAGVRQAWDASRVALDHVIEQIEEFAIALRNA